MAKLFFSYSHKDEALRDQLEIQLSMLKRGGAIESWHDRRIPAGNKLDEAIDEHLESADVILLLVSPDFLASDYCYDVEMTRAMERQKDGSARVIPVILRPCDWMHAPFGKLLACPKDGKPVTKWADTDEAFLDVVQMIRSALPQPTQQPPKAQHLISTHPAPRSSNLRIRKEFTEADRDRLADEAFEFIARFFEGSLSELAERNASIESRFRRIDARTFTAVAYRGGEKDASCTIRLGAEGRSSKSIQFSFGDQAAANSYNEAIYVEADEQSLYLSPIGMAMIHSDHSKHLSQEGAAEYYWAIFIEPLQR